MQNDNEEVVRKSLREAKLGRKTHLSCHVLIRCFWTTRESRAQPLYTTPLFFCVVVRKKMKRFLFTSECVSEGHPDKLADQVSDAVLDACLRADPHAKVACGK